LLVPLLQLSMSNTAEHEELLERDVAQSMCLDAIERFKCYKPYWPLPGEQADGAPPVSEMFSAVELRPGATTPFDKVYLDYIEFLGILPRPSMKRSAVPRNPGLFRLDVSTSWTSRKGASRAIRFARYCFAR